MSNKTEDSINEPGKIFSTKGKALSLECSQKIGEAFIDLWSEFEQENLSMKELVYAISQAIAASLIPTMESLLTEWPMEEKRGFMLEMIALIKKTIEAEDWSANNINIELEEKSHKIAFEAGSEIAHVLVSMLEKLNNGIDAPFYLVHAMASYAIMNSIYIFFKVLARVNPELNAKKTTEDFFAKLIELMKQVNDDWQPIK